MQRFKVKRWFLLPLLVAFPPCVSAGQPSQAASPAPVQVGSPAAEPASTAFTQKPPTPEELGDTLVVHRRYQAAIAAYSKSPQRTAEIWNKMGISYQMMFASNDAIRCYKESLRLNPRNAQVVNNLATVYASLKMYGRADRLYRKALKLDPKSAVVLKNYGTNLLAEHKDKKGWHAYEQAVALDPEIFADRDSPTVENPSNVHVRGAMNYYMAAGCAHAGNVDCAMKYLRLALDEGFTTRKKVASDSQFASLRDNPAFKELLAEQHK